MRGLRKYLTPFAPDQSGAVSVLFELGGIVVICDAGGCTGNVCGFDEPRWFEQKSAIFSAGLRDMDAILGRDDRLVAKLADVADQEGFPAIATMYRRIAEAEKGHEERYLALLKNVEEGTVFKKAEETVWQCRNCGYIYVGTEAPEVCPACLHPQAYFEVKKNNY